MKPCWPTRCNRSRGASAGGFTIVEVLVAMTVTGIGLVSVFGALRMASDVTDRIRNEQTAQLLAESHMTRLLCCPAEQLADDEGEAGKFTWQETVGASRVPDVAEVTVTVGWQHRGRKFSFELVSLRETTGNGPG